MPASSGSRPPLRWLQAPQAATRLSQLCAPPRWRGTTWSSVSRCGLLAAVLADVAVAGEDLAPRQAHARARPPDAVLELDDRRRAQDGRRRPDLGVVVLDDLGLLAEDEPERPAEVADVERLVVGVQEKDDAIQRSPRAGVAGHASGAS